MAHLRSGTLDLAIAVPVRTEKYDRQSEHQYGIGFRLGTSRVLTLPQCPQQRSLGQTTLSSHSVADSSVGNMAISSRRLRPVRCDRPGACPIDGMLSDHYQFVK